MILTDDEITERLESPLNLLNRLKKITRSADKGSSIVSINKIDRQSPPTSAELIENIDDKIAEAAARQRAMNIMNKAMAHLEERIPDIQKPKELSSIATDMSKIIANQSQNQANKGHSSQIIVYAPQVQRLESFDIIDVKEG